jgi:hypothetical protein
LLRPATLLGFFPMEREPMDAGAPEGITLPVGIGIAVGVGVSIAALIALLALGFLFGF